MRDKLLNERAPGVVVSGRRDIGTVMKDRLLAGSQHARHEAEFDERLHADRQKKVPDAIGIVKGIEMSPLVANDRAQVIAEKPVEADVAKAKLLVTAAQLLLPIRPQGERRVTASDTLLPEMRKWLSRCLPIALKARFLHGFQNPLHQVSSEPATTSAGPSGDFTRV